MYLRSKQGNAVSASEEEVHKQKHKLAGISTSQSICLGRSVQWLQLLNAPDICCMSSQGSNEVAVLGQTGKLLTPKLMTNLHSIM